MIYLQFTCVVMRPYISAAHSLLSMQTTAKDSYQTLQRFSFRYLVVMLQYSDTGLLYRIVLRVAVRRANLLRISSSRRLYSIIRCLRLNSIPSQMKRLLIYCEDFQNLVSLVSLWNRLSQVLKRNNIYYMNSIRLYLNIDLSIHLLNITYQNFSLQWGDGENLLQ